MNYIEIFDEDFENNLDGIGVTLFVSGCDGHGHCKNCHNPESWDRNFGKPFDRDAQDIIIAKLAKSHITTLTISGGDPLSIYNRKDVKNLLKTIRSIYSNNKRIWLYTGFIYEDIINDEDVKDLLTMVDILIDGPFIQEERDETCKIRGSKNQRIIRLINGEIIKIFDDENDYINNSHFY